MSLSCYTKKLRLDFYHPSLPQIDLYLKGIQLLILGFGFLTSLPKLLLERFYMSLLYHCLSDHMKAYLQRNTSLDPKIDHTIGCQLSQQGQGAFR